MTLAALSARTASTLARIDRLLALNAAEPPPRSHKAAALLPRGDWLPLWEREGKTLAQWMGERMRGQHKE